MVWSLQVGTWNSNFNSFFFPVVLNAYSYNNPKKSPPVPFESWEFIWSSYYYNLSEKVWNLFGYWKWLWKFTLRLGDRASSSPGDPTLYLSCADWLDLPPEEDPIGVSRFTSAALNEKAHSSQTLVFWFEKFTLDEKIYKFTLAKKFTLDGKIINSEEIYNFFFEQYKSIISLKVIVCISNL